MTFGIHRPQIGDEFFLVVALPDIVLWDKPAAEIFRSRRRTDRARPAADRPRATARCRPDFASDSKRFAHVVEQRLLKFRQLVRVFRPARRCRRPAWSCANFQWLAASETNCFASSGSLSPDFIQRRRRHSRKANTASGSSSSMFTGCEIRRAEFQRRDLLLDAAGSAPAFRSGSAQENPRACPPAARRRPRSAVSEFFPPAQWPGPDWSATTAPNSSDLSAESISFCSNTTDGRLGLCISIRL